MQESFLSSPASRLKYLLERDDERQRRQAIQNVPERPRLIDYDVPNPSTVIPLFENQLSVENQLQQQVTFYQESLERLKDQSDLIANENAMLYERMRQSIEFEHAALLTEDEDGEEMENKEVNENNRELESPKRKHKERLLRTKTECEAESKKHTSAKDERVIKKSIKSKKKLRDKLEEKSMLTNEDDVSMKEENSVDDHSEPSNDHEELTFESLSKANAHDNKTEPKMLTIPQRKKSNTYEGSIPDQQNTSKQKEFNSCVNSQQNYVKGHEMLYEELEKVRQLYQTKTKNLQSLLEASRKQEEEQREEIKKLKADRLLKTPTKKGLHICSKCSSIHGLPLQHEATVAEKKVHDRLTRERDELIEGIKKQQRLVKQGNKRELEAYNQVKKSCELVEQAQLEKQEAIVQSAQYQKDYQTCSMRFQKLQQEFDDHKQRFNKKQKQDMQTMIENLSKKVGDQSNMINVLQVQTEKSTREKVDLKKEAEQQRLHIITQKAETAGLIDDARKDVMEAFKAKTLAEQTVNRNHSESQRREKQKQMAVDQLIVEVQELKRRLYNTEESLQKSQDEVMKLTKNYNTSSQQLQNIKHENKMLQQSFEDGKKRFQYEFEQREQELALLLQESENRFSTNRDELTRLLESQTNIVTKYQDEYKLLARNIENERENNKKTLLDFQTKCKELNIKVLHASEYIKEKDQIIETLTKQMTQCELQVNDYKEQLVLLMNKHNTILRDRHLLTKEIELLRSQLPTNILR